jgi:hypothetical protein
MTGCLTTMAVGYLVSLLEPAPDPASLRGLVVGQQTREDE